MTLGFQAGKGIVCRKKKKTKHRPYLEVMFREGKPGSMKRPYVALPRMGQWPGEALQLSGPWVPHLFKKML